MADYKATYSQVKIISDDTGGLVKLATLERHGEDRKTKLRNNFVGLLEPASAQLLQTLCRQISDRLPAPQPGEIVVGMIKSGLVMCSALALVRSSRFNWTVHDKLGDYTKAFSFAEDHRDGKVHYLYGIKPGDSVIIVEDEVTSGNGVVALTAALRDYGVQVNGIACVIETTNFDGRANIKAATGLDLVSLVRVELS